MASLDHSFFLSFSTCSMTFLREERAAVRWWNWKSRITEASLQEAGLKKIKIQTLKYFNCLVTIVTLSTRLKDVPSTEPCGHRACVMRARLRQGALWRGEVLETGRAPAKLSRLFQVSLGECFSGAVNLLRRSRAGAHLVSVRPF